MKARNLLSIVTAMSALAVSSSSHASCTVDFPNDGFPCNEEAAESTGFGVFVGPVPDLVLNIGIDSLDGLFGGCISPLDLNGNQISECTVCDPSLVPGDGGEEETCETNVFPVELRINQS